MGSGDRIASGGQRRGMSQETFMRMSGRVKNDSRVLMLPSNEAANAEGGASVSAGKWPSSVWSVGLQVELSSLPMGKIDPEDLGWKGALGAGGWWHNHRTAGRVGMRDECSETLLGKSKCKRSTSLQKPPSGPVQPFQ